VVYCGVVKGYKTLQPDERNVTDYTFVSVMSLYYAQRINNRGI